LEDFRRLPFIEKEHIRDRLDDFSVDIPGREYVTTGGSTGIPTGMYRDKIAFARELASKACQYYRVGWNEGARQIVFRGLQIPTGDHTEFVADFNELRCSTYQFGSDAMEIYRQRALEYQPEWIRCYPSSGYVFARYLKDNGKSFPRLKGMLCSSEHLYDFQRDLFAEVFGCRVFIHYGHYEMAVLAGYCEHEDTYHVLPQYGFAELIGSDGRLVTRPGEIGEIVGTSFIMNATPFIRYRTQDLAVFKGWGCEACGRPYQIWERIEGRLQELMQPEPHS
jgi:phenylacetate-CoA ligase